VTIVHKEPIPGSFTHKFQVAETSRKETKKNPFQLLWKNSKNWKNENR